MTGNYDYVVVLNDGKSYGDLRDCRLIKVPIGPFENEDEEGDYIKESYKFGWDIEWLVRTVLDSERSEDQEGQMILHTGQYHLTQEAKYMSKFIKRKDTGDV